MSTKVSTPRKQYLIEKEDVDRNRDVIKGERAIKNKSTEYLPPLASMCITTTVKNDVQQVNAGTSISLEGQAAYNKYLSLASFYNASGRALDGLIGLIFSKDANVELPIQIDYLDTNVDSKGTSLRDFSKKACSEAFIAPRCGVLVARPETPSGASLAEVEALNIRPKLEFYNFDSIINWDFEVINNELKLSLVVLVEEITKRDQFEISVVKQYRVLELIDGVYHQSIYDDKDELVTAPASVIINGNTSSEIPFYFIETESKPPLNDLVDLNLHHYKINADYNSKLYYSSFTIYYETNVQNGNSQNMIIGNGVKWNGGMDANFGILQPDGNADSHRLALEDDEKRMAALGAEQLRAKGLMAESAEAKSLDRVAQNSTTANIAITVSNVIKKALEFALMWQGASGEIKYKLNTDYNPTGMDANKLNALFSTYIGGGISYETFYDNLQKGEIGSVERTAQQEQELIQASDLGATNV